MTELLTAVSLLTCLLLFFVKTPAVRRRFVDFCLPYLLGRVVSPIETCRMTVRFAVDIRRLARSLLAFQMITEATQAGNVQSILAQHRLLVTQRPRDENGEECVDRLLVSVVLRSR